MNYRYWKYHDDHKRYSIYKVFEDNTFLVWSNRFPEWQQNAESLWNPEMDERHCTEMTEEQVFLEMV